MMFFTPFDSISNLQLQAELSDDECASAFNITARTWQSWKEKNKISSAVKEWLFFKAGFVTDKEKSIWFGARFFLKSDELFRDENTLLKYYVKEILDHEQQINRLLRLKIEKLEKEIEKERINIFDCANDNHRNSIQLKLI